MLARKSAPKEPMPFPLDQLTWRQIIRQMQLPPQHEKIVASVLQDMSDQQIADDMGLAVPTVRTYLGRIYKRAAVRSRMQLVLRIMAMLQERAPRHRG
jgi:DNA-binding NarL/FixJ family response regulator